MRKLLTALICTTIAATGLLSAEAKTKKNDPDKRDVEKFLKELAGEHWVDRMKVRDFCSLRYKDPAGDDDYIHVLSGELRRGGHRLIFYNNVPEYLGFYEVEFEPTEYEEGLIRLDSGESTSSGNTKYWDIPVPAKGPAAKIVVDGVPVTFVKNPQLEEKAAGPATAASTIPVVEKEKAASGEVIDYRDWTITMGGKEVVVNAIFVKIEKGKVTIKNAKNGREAEIPGSALSDEDKEYVRRISAQ